MNILSKIFSKGKSVYELGYKIVPLGTYCLPRVITTLNMLKPRKAAGEKTLPFDLGFFWNFDGILDILDNEFCNFYEDVKYGILDDKSALKDLEVLFGYNTQVKHWVSNKLNAIFNHEYMMENIEGFKARYDKRIENFYEYLKDNRYEVYFLIASFSEISEAQIKRLKGIINRYRSAESYNIIIINQSSHSYAIKQKKVYVIDEINDDFDNMLRANNTNWAAALQRKDIFPAAQKFYNNLTDDLEKIILKN